MTKKKKRNRYTEQFKEEALRALETRGTRTIAEVAASPGVPEPLLHSLRGRAKASSAASDRGESLQDEVRRLRRELADVKKDRDVLVKSIAVFVKDRK